MRRWQLVGLIAWAALLLGPAAAEAAFPGQNGLVATAGPGGIYTAGPSQPVLTDSQGGQPSWSPDGARIALAAAIGGNTDIFLINGTGGGRTRLTTDAAHDFYPAWSPDGSQILFASDRDGNDEIYRMNADGSSPTRLTTDPDPDRQPAWSPDGSRIAFTCGPQTFTGYHVCVMNADGTGRTEIGVGEDPDWSPDGTQIAFDADVQSCDPDQFPGAPEIFRMNSDGTGRTQLTSGVCLYPEYTNHVQPAWSPDGTKIAYTQWWGSVSTSSDQPPETAVIKTDGTSSSGSGGLGAYRTDPSWQPVIIGGYARPKGATPFYASLVPAQIGCTAPNDTHAPPLSFGSCSPQTPRSAVLTVGTPDANGNPASFTGSARYQVISGNAGTPLDEADLRIDVSLVDVRCAISSAACPDGPNSDYMGRLLLISPPLQITDKDGQPATNGQGAVTGQTNFPVPFGCTPTASTTIGSSCSISTTADTLVPNAIKEGHRTIWEMGPVHVRDAGPNGTGYDSGCPPSCGDGDETLFLRPGVFTP